MDPSPNVRRCAVLVRLAVMSLFPLLAIGLMLSLLSSTSQAAPGNPVLTPAANVHTAWPTTTISITYNEPISASTVSSWTFAVHAMQSGLVTGSQGVNGGTIVVTPTRAFFAGELVQATATTATLNITGEQPVSPTVWQFRVATIGGSGQFTVGSGFGTGSDGTHVLALGDVDGDGDLDLAVGNYGAQNVVYLNDGDGTFDTTAYNVGPGGDSTVQLALGDVDGDGDLDLAVGNDGGQNVVYLNDGDGTFDTTLYNVGPGNDRTYALALGDVDGDGDLDLAVGNGGEQNVIYLSDGDGTFDTMSYNVGPSNDNTRVLGLGDVDGDGDLDLAVGNVGVQNVVYLNDGDGTFDTTAYNVGPGGGDTRALSLGDVDGDGYLDLVVGNLAEQNVVYLNDGDGTFDTTSTVVGSGNDATHVLALGDVDGDGDLDLAVGNDREQNVVYLNDGDGTFDTTSTVVGPGNDRTWVLALGDVDGDGDLDLAVGDFGAQNVVYVNGEAVPDLAIAKMVSPEPNVAGTGMVYTITILNQGTLTATHVVVSDTLPPSTTLQYVDQTDANDDLLGFGGGLYEDTYWHDIRPGTDDDDWVALTDPAMSPTGVFTSRVMDAGNVSSWTALEWASRRPTWKPLPDNGAAETDYVMGNANMSGNRILLHLDATDTYSDASGWGNDGLCPAATGETCPATGVMGRFSEGLSFDGTLSNTVVISDAFDPERYALEVWVRPATITDTSLILRTDVLSGTDYRYSHLLGISGNRFVHLLNDGSMRAITSTVEVTTGVWYHVVGTAQSGGDLKLFVNGVEEASLGGIGTLWTGGDEYRLGSTYGLSGTAYFSGELDQVAVYSRTLSVGEVLDHYLRGALRLDFQVRSCDDALCAGEPFSSTVYSEQDNADADLPTVSLLDTPDNRYFQYRVSFASDDPAYSPELQWVYVLPDHRAVEASQGTCVMPGASAFTCTLGSLASGGMATVTVPVNIHPSALGVITNTAAVTTPADADPSNNTVTATTTVTALSDIRINKDDVEHLVNLGDVISYHIHVHNYGPSTARSLVVTDDLPTGLVGYPSSSSWTCSVPSETITCTISTLGVGDHWSAIVVTATAPLFEGLITNTVAVTTAATPVFTSTYLTDTEATFVTPLADLAIHKTASPDPVRPGETLTYTVVVTNTGPFTATGVIVTDTVLYGLLGSASGGAWNCVPTGDDIVCSLPGELLPAEAASLTISVTAPLSGSLGNYAYVTGDQVDPDTDNNEVWAYASVLPVADLSIDKRDVLDPVDAGSVLTYVLTVTNTGPVPAGALTSTLSFTNGQQINIWQWGAGRAWRYPSNLQVGGLSGVIHDLTVRLYDVSHTYPGDMSVLLVGPDQQGVVLMSNVGSGAQIDDLTLTFHDMGAPMPMSGTLTSTITYRPTNYGLPGDFSPPAPDSPYGGSLSSLYGTDPNGLWRLYVMDTVASDGGSIAAGWSLHFSTMTTDTVTVSDTLPAGLTGLNSVVPPGWLCAMVGDEWTCTIEMLPVNSSTVVTVTATAPITGGVITNTAAITSTTVDLWPDDNVTEITTTVVAVTDLGIVKVVAPAGTVGAGSPITYTLVVSNAGPSPVEATVTVTDLLPAGLGGATASGTGWACSTGSLQVDGHMPVTCTTSGMTVGQVSIIAITATAPLTPGLIANTAGITAAVSDPDGLNNTASVSVTVSEHADLEILKLVQPAAVTPDGVLTFTIQITNAGPSTVTAISVRDVATDVATLGDADVTLATGWTCTTTTTALDCTALALSAGEGATIVVTATAPSGAGVISNSAAVASALVDLIPGNNVSLVTVTVSTPPVANAGADQTVYAGDVVTLDGTGSTDAEDDLPLMYGWAQVGGPPVALSDLTVGQPTFAAPGTPTVLTFSLTVTDSIGLCSGITDTVAITIVESPFTYIYLPVVMRNYEALPDLVVDSIVATGNSIQVVIRNQGDAPVERAYANEFWVDVYLNPSTPPTHVNQTWQSVGSQGGVWGVIQSALPLDPGDTLVLAVTPTGGAYYRSDLSRISWPLASGTILYAQVDSAHTATTYGAIIENHERVGGPYNNITGPVLSP